MNNYFCIKYKSQNLFYTIYFFQFLKNVGFKLIRFIPIFST